MQRKLTPDIAKEIALFTDQQTYVNLRKTCGFFREALDHQTFLKSPHPLIYYNAFSKKSPDDKSKVSLQPTKGGLSVKSYIQLKSGNILTGNYADLKKNTSQICLWKIEDGKLLSEFETSLGGITHLREIEKNIVVIGHHDEYCEFYDFHNEDKPRSLAKIALQKEEYIYDSAIISQGKLVFLSYQFNKSEMNTNLKILHYDAKAIQPESIHITELKLPYSDVFTHIFSLKNNQFVIASRSHLYFYDLTINPNSAVNIIDLHEYSPWHVIQLKNQKILTASVKGINSKKTFHFDIWDPTAPKGREHEKSIDIEWPQYDRQWFTMFEKDNGELLVTSDSYILIIDPQESSENSLLCKFRCQLSPLSSSQFIEDGRYLMVHAGRGLHITKFPLIPESTCKEIAHPDFRQMRK